MLTYALVDRGTVAITGLDQQTNDKAKFEGQYYSDKLPGFSVAGDAAIRDRQVGIAAAEPSAQPTPRSRIGPPTTGPPWALPDSSRPATAVLLVFWGRELGCLPRSGVLDRPRLRTGDPGLRLRHARLRPPGVCVRPVRVVFSAVEARTAPRRLVASVRSPASWRPTRP